MSPANVVCANVYIRIRSIGLVAARQKPGACPDERCHNAFFVGDDGRLKGPLTSALDVMIACWSADVRRVITELISQFTDT